MTRPLHSLALPIALAFSSVIAAAQSPAEKTLLVRAKSLAAGGQLEIAVQIWQQVLLADAANQEALAGIAKADMEMGKTGDAEKYLQRLRSAGGSAEEIATIKAMAGLRPQAERLNDARRLAQVGRYPEALRIYRNVFGDQPPPSAYALAYFDTEAAIPEERPQAIAGLRKLKEQFPGDFRYAVTLGRVLTYDPKTRPEGVAILRQYDKVPEAHSALEQAETWNRQSTITVTTNSSESDQAKSPAAAISPVARAYRALNAGHIEEAGREFQSVLVRQPGNRAAQAGMGYVYLQQKQFGQAASAFEKARASGAKGLEDAISTARFWQSMAEAGSALQAKDSALAMKSYRAALVLKPSDGQALEGLAGALALAGDYAQAIRLFEKIVQEEPQDWNAWRGLFLAQSSADDAQGAQEALATDERMPEGIRLKLASDFEYLRILAQDNLAMGRGAEAERVLQQALHLPFPDEGRGLPVDQQLQYAGLLMMAKKYEAALRLYRQAIALDEKHAEPWLALIAAEHEIGQDTEALATAGQTPQLIRDQEQKDPSFLALIGSIYQSQGDMERAQTYLEQALSAAAFPRPKVAFQLASIYTARGLYQKAYPIYRDELEHNPDSLQAWAGVLSTLHQSAHDQEALEKLEFMPEAVRLRLEQEASYLRTLAAIQAASGRPEAAAGTFLRLASVYRKQKLPMPPGDQLQYGWLLLKIRDNDRLYSVVSELSASQGLSKEQDTEARRLWSSWSIQRANDTFAAGDQRRSLAILQAAAQSFPKDRNVENALAVDLRAGEAKPALAIYLTLDMSQATIAEYQGAIGAALAAHDRKRAAAWLQTAMDRYHDDPIILKMAAQLEQSRGHNTRAAEYYKAALGAMGPPAGTAAEAQFTPDQRLMELLVPGTRLISSAFSGVETSQRPGNSGMAPVTERQRIEDQLAVIQGASSSWVGGDSGVSYRSGQPGYDRLAIYSAGLEASNMIAPGLRTTVITRPVLLESGQATSAATFQQGTLPAGTLSGSQSASGLGGEIQVSTSSFGAALGYSPHGFLVENVIGRLSIHPQLAHFTLDFSRTPILDTQLSYAGLRDLGSRSSTSPGNIWGGMIANSGELHLAFGDEKSGWYAQGGGQYITGHHVEENRRVDGDSGIYWAVWNRPEYGHLSLGVNLFGMSYEHNLGYFTYGQGGYFSPGAYGLAGVPFTFNGHHGPRFHYRVAGSLGVQAFKEDASPFYPLDPVLQSRNNNPYYAENTTVGGNYNFAAEGAYLLAGHWYVGGFTEFNNSRDYASDKIGFFVRYVARPQPALGDSGPTGLFPVEGLRPLQVP